MLRTLKKVLIVFAWSTGVLGVCFLLGFVDKKQNLAICKKVNIEIDQDIGLFFVEERDINRALYMNRRDSFISKPLSSIRINDIEKRIRSNPFIEKADVFVDLAGNLQVDVEQRKPVLRIINSSYMSYYIDDNGLKMPLNYNYTARVLVASGNISESHATRDTLRTQQAKDLLVLAEFIDDDKFWRAQIEQIYVDEDGDIELIPRVGNHRIILGEVSDLEGKFTKLMIFYKQAMPKVGWNTYSSINLKYQNQIICSRYPNN